MKKIESMHWDSIYNSLNEKGYASIKGLLSQEECEHLSGMYSDIHLYRSVINM